MDNEVRIPEPGESSRAPLKVALWIVGLCAAVGIGYWVIKDSPRVFGFEDELQASRVDVTVFEDDSNSTRAQAIRTDGEQGKTHELWEVIHPSQYEGFVGDRVLIKTARVQRRTADNVFTIGLKEPEQQIFVVAHMPETRAGQEELKRVSMPGQRVLVAGRLLERPGLDDAKKLFNLGSYIAEGAVPPARVYIEAIEVKAAEFKGQSRDVE